TAHATSFTTADHVVFTVGQAGHFTITTTGFPVAVLSESGSLPSGVSFTDNGNGTATLAGTPGQTTGACTFDIRASNGYTPPVSQAFPLTVVEPLTITTADTTTFTATTSGNFSIGTTPGLPTATTLTKSGPLPRGVSWSGGGNGTATLHGKPAVGT